jgi:hypothetical protein
MILMEVIWWRLVTYFLRKKADYLCFSCTFKYPESYKASISVTVVRTNGCPWRSNFDVAMGVVSALTG